MAPPAPSDAAAAACPQEPRRGQPLELRPAQQNPKVSSRPAACPTAPPPMPKKAHSCRTVATVAALWSVTACRLFGLPPSRRSSGKTGCTGLHRRACRGRATTTL
eukprot:scaffold21402_cov59-Phaeocystis_antarctica.AAC.3